MAEDVRREQSEFNMAVSYLNRLNTLFYMADEAAINLDSHNWFHSLLAIFRELSTKMKDAEIEKKNETIKRINDRLYINNSSPMRAMRGIPPDLYKELHDFEISLRRILKESGLEGKNVDDAMKALK